MSDVYLKAWHGGLGDALQFSTLPEEFEKQQGRKTYITSWLRKRLLNFEYRGYLESREKII